MYPVPLRKPKPLPDNDGIQTTHDPVKIPDTALMFPAQIQDQLPDFFRVGVGVSPVKITIIRYSEQDGCFRQGGPDPTDQRIIILPVGFGIKIPCIGVIGPQ